jgi:hypothetical protein
MVRFVAVMAGVMALAGCMERKPMTVSEFMENEAALYGTLERCERERRSVDEVECSNARLAAKRILVIEQRAMEKAREEAFQSAREEYRQRLHRERELRMRAEAEAEQARLQALVDSQPTEESGEEASPAEAPPPED